MTREQNPVVLSLVLVLFCLKMKKLDEKEVVVKIKWTINGNIVQSIAYPQAVIAPRFQALTCAIEGKHNVS
jgi:hypothetical protein